MEDITLDVARLLGVAREERAYFLGYGVGGLEVRIGDERRVLPLPPAVATFARSGGELRGAPLDLAPGDRLRLMWPAAGADRRPAASRSRATTKGPPEPPPAAHALDRLPPRGRAAPLDRDALPGFVAARSRGGVARGVGSRRARCGLLGQGGDTVVLEGLAVRWTLGTPETWFELRRGVEAGRRGWVHRRSRPRSRRSGCASSAPSPCRGAATPTRRSSPTTTRARGSAACSGHRRTPCIDDPAGSRARARSGGTRIAANAIAAGRARALGRGHPRPRVALARARPLDPRGRRAGGGALVRSALSPTGRAFVVGITGPPGAGKSTLVARLARLVSGPGRTVGILAVDPDQPVTGGALLGDRIRMQDLATDRGVFIRSMATRGAMGGLAPATRDAVDLLDAAGLRLGPGRDRRRRPGRGRRGAHASTPWWWSTVPGLGDDIQAIKAGILEIADVFVDQQGRPRRRRAHGARPPGLARARPRRAAAMPPILQTVATRDQGIDALRRGDRRAASDLEASGELARRRRSTCGCASRACSNAASCRRPRVARPRGRAAGGVAAQGRSLQRRRPHLPPRRRWLPVALLC